MYRPERVEMTGLGPAQPEDATTRQLAFERLTDQRLLRAYRLATLVLRSQTDAQDAVHDAAVLAWTRFDGLRDRDRFDAWFDRIVVNVCRQRLQRGGVRPLLIDVPDQVSRDPRLSVGDGTSGRAEQDALRAALGRLKPEHRVVVVLRHLDGHSIGAIAARTGEREGTVKSRLHYALRELRAAYDAAQRDPEAKQR